MRPVSYIVVAALAGFIGGNVLQAPQLYDKVTNHFSEQPEPAGFWSTPAITGYGKIHYVDTPVMTPTY
jgi:hypothetical protein